MPMFRKRPVVIEAVQFTGENIKEIAEFVGPGCQLYENGDYCIETLEGDHRACPDDWIIKGVKGEFYPCKPDIFEATYNLVEGYPESNG